MKINPLEIKEEDPPLIVLADNLRSFTGKLIKIHTKGEYSHIMSMCRPYYFASQNWFYKEVPVEVYMKKGYRLKFFKPKDLTPDQREEWLDMTARELKAPWWRRRYDIIGVIFGQVLKLRWINNPTTNFCSERVRSKIIKFFKVFVRKHPSPSDCNKALTACPEKAEVLGHYFWDNNEKKTTTTKDNVGSINSTTTDYNKE